MAIKSTDVLRNLSRDKLKQYIFYLTQKYYESYKKGDVEAYDIAINQLFFIVEEYDDKYVNLNGFICYCLSPFIVYFFQPPRLSTGTASVVTLFSPALNVMCNAQPTASSMI